MKWTGLNDLRESYLSFFESKGHLRLNSFPLVPQGDNSILLINAGMTPLKKYFQGIEEPPRHRVTTCQKCIRTPDIENVGKTARHGTYFEMLGNFSFGDYFKHEAIAWAWEYLTKVLEIPPERLWVTIYEQDDEAGDIWANEVGVPRERIIKLGKADNFWEHGSGPCGPCSEIHYDRGEKYGHFDHIGQDNFEEVGDCDRIIEIWNNVFSQFDNDGHGNYSELKQKNIDTGMGLERLACVVQGVGSLFDVDTVRNITNKVSEIAGKHYGDSDKTDVSLRVITDHIRSTVMMICDGVIPSNEGRGYVLRRLLRRAVRHGKLLGIDKPFMSDVASTVINESGGAYPELVEKQKYIHKVIENEEASFNKTIDSGLAILNDKIAASDGKELSAADAFQLYDTYGFPIDLTLEVLEEQGMTTSREEFDRLMNEQRERAREDRKKMGDLGWQSEDLGLDKSIKTAFDGYTTLEESAKILAIVNEGEVSGAAAKGEKITVVLDRTPFYAEMGGQIGDHGVITGKNGAMAVSDVQKTKDGKYMHIGVVTEGELSVEDEATASVDAAYRQAICRAHTSTHLLQKALRTVLGDHVEQAGSYTANDHIRFDFTHFAALTAEELAKVEDMVNDAILAGSPVITEEMSIDDAKKKGAMALFGEKYGQTVRVVQAGDSIELCGGTHLDNTAKAGSLKIIGEASVAAGVRRIEAVTGKAVLKLMNDRQAVLNEAAAALKTNPNELSAKIEQQVNDMRALNKKLEKMGAKVAAMQMVDLFNVSRNIKGVEVVATKLDDASADMLRTMGDDIKGKKDNMVAVLSAVNGDKVSLLCVCGAEAVKKGAHAGKIIKEVAKIVGGGGGGRPDSATAGGKNPAKLEEALEAVNNIVDAML